MQRFPIIPHSSPILGIIMQRWLLYLTVVLIKLLEHKQMFPGDAVGQMVIGQLDVAKLRHGSRSITKELLVLLLVRSENTE